MPGPSNTENPLIVLALRYLFFQEPQTLQYIRDQVAQIGLHTDLGNTHAQLVNDLPESPSARDRLRLARPPTCSR